VVSWAWTTPNWTTFERGASSALSEWRPTVARCHRIPVALDHETGTGGGEPMVENRRLTQFSHGAG
ncbi:MAG: hypothetical protein QF548_11330, partial [Acidimicrobiales bacterium]|nr:hypothetical protein [Acidimicrobiales bacterium]